MITFQTTPKFRKILESFDISINALEYAFSFILNVYTQKFITKYTTIKIVCRSKQKNFGEYEFNSKKIVICTACLQDKQTFLSALLHEFRHWIQHSVDNISPIAIASEGISYENNAYEKQCCSFEKEMYSVILILMDCYQKIKEEFTQ